MSTVITTEELSFYRAHSPITDPGSNAHLYDALPDDLESLCKVSQGLVYHYMADVHTFGWHVPPNRLPEIDTRWLPAMLDTLMAMDGRPLGESREPQNRIVGCCRDFTALFVSMLRQKGIPARSRHGFAAYLAEGYYIDHVIAEVWDAEAVRWRMIDPEMPKEAVRFDSLNVSRDLFVVGGEAWLRCRAGDADPELFGLGPGGPVQGDDFIASRMLLDLAALNKREMLCWENWGLSLNTYDAYSEDDLALMHEVAQVTATDPVPYDAARDLYKRDARLTVPDTVLSFSAALPQPWLGREVAVSFTE